MFAHAFRFSVSVAFLAVLFSQAPGQEKEPPKKPADKPPPAPGRPADDYRQYFRTPETVQDFWNAMKFEIEVGEFGLAGKHLKGFLAKKPAKEELLAIQREEGMTAFLRLRNIPKWSDDPKEQAEIAKGIENLLAQVTAAVKEELTDAKRLGLFTKNLTATPEERAYALKELYRSGAAAVPFLIDELRNTSGEAHRAIIDALTKLSPATLPAVVAAVDVNDPGLQLELMDVLRQRAATSAVPFLWHLAAPKQPEPIRKKATETISYLRGVTPDKLPSPKAALADEAERYYQHQVVFPNSAAVVIWRWDPKQNKLVEGAPVPATRAEEYYGLLFAGQALEIDPAYQPAQIVFLSLAIDKGFERGGIDQPLSKGAPEVAKLLASVNPELINAVLDRALADNRVPVILGAVRALGDLADPRVTRSTDRSQPPLLRALYYPDRRVQLAAADALLRMPGSPGTVASTRIVDILRRAAAAEPEAAAKPKILVGFNKEDVANAVAQAITQAGFTPVIARTGRDALRQLEATAGIDGLILHYALPDPGLSYLLGQLRADANAGRLPLLLVVPRENEDAYRRRVEAYRNVWVIPEGAALDADGLKRTLAARFADPGRRPLTEAERKDNAERALDWLARLAASEGSGYDVRPATAAVLGALRSTGLSDQAMLAAIATASRLPAAADGQKPQSALAAFLTSSPRPAPVKSAAAKELVRHVQVHGVTLSANEVRSLEDLMAAKEADPTFKANLALLLGSMRPDARLTGERLRSFEPPAPAAPPTPAKEAPKEEAKEPAKDKGS